MGVYISDLEIPTDDKYITIQICPDGSIWQQYRGMLPNAAIPVPPHGRLIDADAVSLEGGPYEYDEWCKWALEQYQDAPTVIPADHFRDATKMTAEKEG